MKPRTRLRPNWLATVAAGVLIGFFVGLGMIPWMSLLARALPTRAVAAVVTDRNAYTTTASPSVKRYRVDLLLEGRRAVRAESSRELYERIGSPFFDPREVVANVSVLGGKPVSLELRQKPLIVLEGIPLGEPKVTRYQLLLSLRASLVGGVFFLGMTGFVGWNLLSRGATHWPVVLGITVAAGVGGFQWWLVGA